MSCKERVVYKNGCSFTITYDREPTMKPLEYTQLLYDACHGKRYDMFEAEMDNHDNDFKPTEEEYSSNEIPEYFQLHDGKESEENDEHLDTLAYEFSMALDYCEFAIHTLLRGDWIDNSAHYLMCSAEHARNVSSLALVLIAESRDDYVIENDFLCVIDSLVRRLEKEYRRICNLDRMTWMNRRKSLPKRNANGLRLYTDKEAKIAFCRELPMILDALRRIHVDFVSCGETNVFQIEL